jgi:hypothetical protein
VHRLLGEESQDCRLHVAASCPAAGHLAEAVPSEAEARVAAHSLAPDPALAAFSAFTSFTAGSVAERPLRTFRPMIAAPAAH